MKSAIILGLMTGTSLDGLDFCLVKFDLVDGEYQYKVLKSDSYEYSEEWREKLKQAHLLSALNLQKLDVDIAKHFAREVNSFLDDSEFKVNYIASHGHTVFHQPENGFTTQIGNGNTLFSETKVPVIYDFRSLDVALGGQGAPLVPIGDLHLFKKFVACINFGGIANISFQKNDERFANDICPVNMALSDLTEELNLPYDDKGDIARLGKINYHLLKELNELFFYQKIGPKSLGIEWYKTYFQKLIKNGEITVEDRLRTVVEHIAVQISLVLNTIEEGEVLVTGGGVYNLFLIGLLQSKIKQKIIVPSKELIEFKEALIFAFLGWLRINNKINVLKTVTGASSNSSSGLIIE